jgi:hypothetical protein
MHRNHMPVMSETALTLPLATPYDFTVETNIYGHTTDEVAIELETGTGIFGLIAGDINSDGKLIYSGGSNDRGMIISKIFAEGGTTLNSTIDGYYDEDNLMDYEVKYSGPGNDRGIISANIFKLTGSLALNKVYESVVPGVVTKSSVIENESVHIQLKEDKNYISATIISDETFVKPLIDNIQFTLVWKKEDHDLIAPLLSGYEGSYGLYPQGEPQMINDNYYQVFVSVLPVVFQNNVNPGDEVAILRFNNPGDANLIDKIKIINNDVTNSINGDYYISFFGQDHTGHIKASVLDVDMNEAGLISVYPNPVTGDYLYMSLGTARNELSQIRIMDITGKTVMSKESYLSKERISIDQLKKGVYIIQLKNSNQNFIQKIIIQ